jgi:hypothetical protein
MTDHLGQFVASRCNCGGFFSGNHKDVCAGFSDERRGEQASQPEGSPRLVGAEREPTPGTPSRGRSDA